MNRKIVRSSSKHLPLPAALKSSAGKLAVQLSKTGGKTTALFGGGSGSGYVTFGSNRKSMRGAFAFANPVSVDIDPKLEKIRASSRDLFMNSPIATGILKRARTNIINSGLILQARIDREFLGLSDEEADAKEEQIEREFNIWSRSKNCDAFRRLDFYAMQGLALISKLMSGDVFAALPYIPRAGWPYQLCIKLIEADFVSNPNGTMDTETLISGVETDSTGQVVAYHISNRHPNDIYPKKWERVPAFGEKSGRQNILHLFDADRPGQRRGIAILAPVIESLKQITRLTEAELMASVITAFLSVFIETSVQSPLDGGLPDVDKIADPENVAADKGTIEMGNGSIIELPPGTKANPVDPKRPNGAFDPFFQAIVKQIGAAIEMPAEIVLLSFESSYSAARAAMLQAWKWFISQRNSFKREFCYPIYEAFLEEEVISGRLDLPGFLTDLAIRAAWSGNEWIGQGMGQINPEVETTAARSRIDGNLSTHAKEVALIDGDDWDSMFPSRVREAKKIREAGLMPVDNKPAPVTKTDENTGGQVPVPENPDSQGDDK